MWDGATELSARNIASLGGGGAEIGKDWQTRDVLERPAPASADQGETIFVRPKGPDLCHRYIDGARTDEPLWPWPMNQRIIEATHQSGRGPVDVTATMEALLGPIPSPCRSAQLSGSEKLSTTPGR